MKIYVADDRKVQIFDIWFEKYQDWLKQNKLI